MIRKKFRADLFLLGAAGLVVGYLAVVPVGMLIYGSFRSGPPGKPGNVFTVGNYVAAYLDPELYELLGNSLLFAAGSSLVALAVGTTLAWIYLRTNTPLRGAIALVALFPFFTPGILETIAWILLLSPKIGLINTALMRLFALETAPFNIYSFAGLVWVEGLNLYPVVFLLMSGALASMDASLEEAALMSGSSPMKSFRKITLRLMSPALLSAFLIIFIRGFEAFEVPALIGMPANFEVFATKIYLAIRQFPSNYGLASTISVLLLALSGAGIYFYRRATSQEGRYATVAGKSHSARTIDLGKSRYLVSGLCMLWLFLTVVLPIATILWSSFLPFYTIPSAESFAQMSLSRYRHVLEQPLTFRAFKNSLWLSSVSALIIVLFAAAISWVTVKSKLPGRGALETLCFLPIAVPGIVFGLSLIWLYLALPIPIYGTVWILLVAYVTKHMPHGMRFLAPAMNQIHKELEEASIMSGGSWLQTFKGIFLPLLFPTIVACWVYNFITLAREMSASILLYSQDSEVLSVVIFELWEDGNYTEVCALGILMILTTTGVVLLARSLGSELGVRRSAAA